MGFFKWLEYGLVRLAVACLRLSPVRVAYFLGEQIGWVSWRVLRSRRSTVKNNLIIVQRWLQAQGKTNSGQVNGISVDAAAKEVFCRSGANLLSSFSFAALPLKKRLQQVEFESLDVLESAVTQGHGVVLLMAHMGPWEVVPAVIIHLVHNLGTQLGAIYRPLSNRYMEKWYRCQRESQGTELFNRKDGLSQAFKFLKSGGMLALLADQRVRAGEVSEFFGESALTTPLVGLLSKRTKAPVVSLTLGYDRSCKLRVGFRLVSFEEANSRADYAKLTNQELERMLSSDVTNAFWLHRRFIT
jgi:Kdo2-lipid IVA lauroyltransferase/acyltransferase